MIILPTITLKMLMQSIVSAAHELSDETGSPHATNTIPEAQLRMAAITALQIATGEPVWPGDKTIKFKRPKVQFGVFQEDGP